jgi:PAS domain S-box-containing protein
MKNPGFIKLIRTFGIIIIIVLSLLIIGIDIFFSCKDFETQTEKVKNSYVEKQKRKIKDEVLRVVKTIRFEKSLAEKRVKNLLKEMVYVAHSIAESIYIENKGKKNIDEIKKMIVQTLRRVRFANGKSYFFITTLNGVSVLFADKPELEGKNLFNVQGSRHNFVVRKMIEIVKKHDGEGFYEYYWSKPEFKGFNYKKILFVKEFKPFNWFIGTGLYLEDIKENINRELTEKISRIRFGKEGYIFINRFNGDALISNGKVLGGKKKLWEASPKYSDKLKSIFKKELKAAITDSGDYIFYSWIKLSKPNKEAPKVSFIYGIKDLKWIVGAGVYLDDIEKKINAMKNELNIHLQHKVFSMIGITLIVMVFFLWFIEKLTIKLEKDTEAFLADIQRTVEKDEFVDVGKIYFSEFKTLAESINKMLSSKMEIKENLIQSEEKFRKIFEYNLDSMTLSKLNEIGFVNVNHTFTKLTGYSKEEVIGKGALELNLFKNSENRDKVLELLTKYGFFENFEAEFVTKSGETKFGLMSGIVIDIKGESYILTMTRDVSDLRYIQRKLSETEETSEAILRALPDLIFVLDDNYIFKGYYTSNIKNLLKTPDEFMDKTVDEVLPAKLAQLTKKNIDKVLKTREIAVFKYSIEINGKKQFEEARMVPKGKNEVLAIIRDITSEMQAEKERIKISRLETLGIVAGGIAHDFNNILAGLFGNLEMLKMTLSKKEPSYKFLERAYDSMERAKSLTKQLLTFSKGGEPVLDALDLKSLIKDFVKFNLTGSNVKPVFNIAEDLWNIKADKGQISQVIGNLVINAKQAMPDGGNIYVKAENAETEFGEYVRIHIKDEGVGIEQENLDKIFDPFFTTKQEGSGLGLSTVHSIIRKHNGTITVESVVGKGTVFIIMLPAEKNLSGIKNIVDKHESELIFANLKILIMDDESMIREVAKDMLKSLGCFVDEALDGDEAVKKYKKAYDEKTPYDIVIMDLTIPGKKGGKEAVKEILEINENAVVIVASGYSTDPIIANYEEYGFSGRLMKPFKFMELKEEIRKIILRDI